MQALSDEQLMQKVCQEGQLDKLGVLFERYHQPIFGFFVHHTANHELSQDLTQNVFERLLKYYKTYKIGASFKTWLYQIARNVRYDHYRKNRVATNPLEEVYADRNRHFAENPKLDIEQEEEVALLYRAIGQLPEDKREILILSQIQELEYKELSRMLNITENSARVKVHRALKQLKTIFQKIK